MGTREPEQLSRRERQIMDVLYRHGKATATEVLEHLSDPPSNSAIRTLLTILEDKGHVRHEQLGARYVYLPTVPRERASKKALQNLLHTFFEGSKRQAIAALLEMPDTKLSREELDGLSKLIEQAKKEGR